MPCFIVAQSLPVPWVTLQRRLNGVELKVPGVLAVQWMFFLFFIPSSQCSSYWTLTITWSLKDDRCCHNNYFLKTLDILAQRSWLLIVLPAAGDDGRAVWGDVPLLIAAMSLTRTHKRPQLAFRKSRRSMSSENETFCVWTMTPNVGSD